MTMLNTKHLAFSAFFALISMGIVNSAWSLPPAQLIANADVNSTFAKARVEPNEASNVNAEPTKIDCEQGVATIDKQACAQSAYNFSNRSLATTYQAIMIKMRAKTIADTNYLNHHRNSQVAKDILAGDNTTENRLTVAQRAWNLFRDANCYLIAASTSIGGSGEGTENLICLNNMTIARDQELKQISNNLFNR